MDKYNKKGDPNRVPSDKEIRKILDRELRNNQEARRTFHDLKILVNQTGVFDKLWKILRLLSLEDIDLSNGKTRPPARSMEELTKAHPDIVERVLRELTREVLGKEELIRRLEFFHSYVLDFLKDLKQIDWFSNVGLPFDEPPNNTQKVKRVFSWEEAHKASRTPESDEVSDNSRNFTCEIIERHGRQILEESAFDLYNEYFSEGLGKDIPYDVKWAWEIDIEGALDEIITRDRPNKQQWFLNKFQWYSLGHWPCGGLNDGTLIVY